MGLFSWLDDVAANEAKLNEEIFKDKNSDHNTLRKTIDNEDCIENLDPYQKRLAEDRLEEYEKMYSMLKQTSDDMASFGYYVKDTVQKAGEWLQDYHDYLQEYPNHLGIKQELRTNTVWLRNQSMQIANNIKEEFNEIVLPSYFTEEQVTTLRNFETNIRNLQKKLKESNIEEHLFVIVDQLSWYYYGVFDAPTYKVAHRKDGSSFPLVSESFNRLFKELQDELYEEDKREREEKLFELQKEFNKELIDSIDDISRAMKKLTGGSKDKDGVGLGALALGRLSVNALKNWVRDRDREFVRMLGKELGR